MLASPPLPTGSAVVDELGALTRDYRTAFLRYLPRHDETALAAAYDLGELHVALSHLMPPNQAPERRLR